MVTDEIVSYAREQLGSGYSEEQVRQALAEQGWTSADVEAVMQQVLGGGIAGEEGAASVPTSTAEVAGSVSPSELVAEQPTDEQMVTAAAQAQALMQQEQSDSTQVTDSLAVETASPTPAGRRGPSKGWLLGVLALILILGGGAVTGYWLWNRPEVVLGRMWNKAQEIHAFDYQGQIMIKATITDPSILQGLTGSVLGAKTVRIPTPYTNQLAFRPGTEEELDTFDFSSPGADSGAVDLAAAPVEAGLPVDLDEPSETAPAVVEFGVNFSGVSDYTNRDAYKGEGTVGFTLTGLEDYATVLGVDVENLLRIDTKVMDQVWFVRLGNIPALPMLPEGFVGLLNEQWIQLDMEALADTYGFDVETYREEYAVSQERQAELQQAVRDSDILVITGVHAGAELDGRPMHRFNFSLDREALIELLLQVAEILGEDISQIDEAQVQEVRESLQEVNLPTGEIWIGKRDSYLYRLILTSDVTPKDTEGLTAQVVFDYQMSAINQAKTIEAPGEYKSIEEVLGELTAMQASTMFPVDDSTRPDMDPVERDDRRNAEAHILLNALFAYQLQVGALPEGIPVGNVQAARIGRAPGRLNLETVLVPKYLDELPMDPSIGSVMDTGYTVYQTETGKVVVTYRSELSGELVAVER